MLQFPGYVLVTKKFPYKKIKEFLGNVILPIDDGFNDKRKETFARSLAIQKSDLDLLIKQMFSEGKYSNKDDMYADYKKLGAVSSITDITKYQNVLVLLILLSSNGKDGRIKINQ